MPSAEFEDVEPYSIAVWEDGKWCIGGAEYKTYEHAKDVAEEWTNYYQVDHAVVRRTWEVVEGVLDV